MRTRPEAQGHTAVVLDGLVDHLDKILDAYFEWCAETKWEPADDSPMEWETARLRKQYGPVLDWDGEDAHYAFSMSVLYLGVVTQHLEAIRVLLRERLAIFGLQLPVRTSLEMLGQVCWLLDPRLASPDRSPRDRAARWCLLRMGDLRRQKVAAKSLGHPQFTRFGQDLAAFQREVRERFYKESEWDPAADPKTKLPRDPKALRDEKFPGGADRLVILDELTGGRFNPRGVYDYLSNNAHPTSMVITDSLDMERRSFSIPDAVMPYRLTRAVMLDFLYTWTLVAGYVGTDVPIAETLRTEIDHLPDPGEPDGRDPWPIG